MPSRESTNEFSICLLPDEETIRDIISLRQYLPDSPYRDDTPHITLLRGITSTVNLSDTELVSDVQKRSQLEQSLPVQGTVVEVANRSNQFYSDSGLLLLHPSKELIDLRTKVSNLLLTTGYTIEQQELTNYIPHITIRLGVPLKEQVLQATIDTFFDRTVTFGKWVLFRLELQKGARQMKEIHL